MKLLFACLALTLLLACSSANAQLVNVSDSRVHVEMGKSIIIKAFVANPNVTFANITVSLGGDYPSGLARLLNETDRGIYVSSDGRSAIAELNPMEEKALNLVISSTIPRTGGYSITLNAITTADATTRETEIMNVVTDFEPSFPGLESWGIALILGLSVFAYWKKID